MAADAGAEEAAADNGAAVEENKNGQGEALVFEDSNEWSSIKK